MEKLKLLRVIASTLVIASIIAINPIGASAEWKQDFNGWWNTEGSSWSVGWKQIDGKWYYFGQDGYMAHDTTIDGYKLGSDGAWIQSTSTNSTTQTSGNHDSSLGDKESTQITPPETSGAYKSGSDSFNTGWKLISGKYYYFSSEGAKEYDTTVDGYYLGEDGAWDASKGKTKLQDFSMKTENNVYSLGTKKIKYYITNNTNLDSDYGISHVEKFENNKWNALEYRDDVEFEAIATILNAKSKQDGVLDLSQLKEFKKLTAGNYRIVEEIGNSDGITNVKAEFKIQ